MKTKVRNAAFKYLTKSQQKHSKMKLMEYRTFRMQDYLSSPMFNYEERNLLFRLRTRTVCGIKSDFKGVYIVKLIY